MNLNSNSLKWRYIRGMSKTIIPPTMPPSISADAFSINPITSNPIPNIDNNKIKDILVLPSSPILPLPHLESSI